MSKTLNDNKYFLQLLLNTNKRQAHALIYTLTDKQIQSLSEIAFNLLRIQHTKNRTQQVKKYQSLLKKIASKKISNNKKKAILEKRRNSVIKALHLFKKELLSLAQ